MPALGSRIESKKASLLSLLPISDRFGPTSFPWPLTTWHLLHVAVVLNSSLPWSTLPLISSSLASGGNGVALADAGSCRCLAASARTSGEAEAKSTLATVKLRSAGNFLSLASDNRYSSPDFDL